MNVSSLENFDCAYSLSNPNLEFSSKILNGLISIQNDSIGYFFGELQIYDTLSCFGEVQILNGEIAIQYLSGTYEDVSLYGTLEVMDTTTLNGVMEVL